MTTQAPTLGAADPDEPATATRRRRRSVMSSNQRFLLAAMVVGALVLGALSSGRPTGHAVVDTAYRALFVAGIGLAASRARRWSLVVAAAIATVSSVGLGLMFAAVALVMTVLAVWRDVRNRSYGACIGAFIAMACLRLDVDWFVGASAVVAALAVLPVIVSGYRVSRSRARRVVRWGCAVAILLMVVGGGMAIFEALTLASPLQTAVSSTTDGINLVRDGKTTEAARRFETATARFRSVSSDASRWWLFPVRMVPIVSQNVEVIPVMASAGAELTEAAATTAAEVDYSRIRREGGGVDLEQLAAFRGPVLDIGRRLRAASGDVDRIESPWMVWPLRERVDEFSGKVDELSEQTDLASLALDHGPPMFGSSGERHYLVLLGNPAEARDLGGHIGNFAELSLIDGSINLERVGRPLELSQPELDGTLDESGIVPPSMLALRPATYPQNWGGSMDFPTDAKVAARLYQNLAGHRIDGVLYADPYTLAAMLAITGPLPVPGLDRQLSSADAVEFLTLGQFSAFPDQSQADDSLTEFVRQLFDRLTTTTLPSPAELGRLFGPLVKQGRFRLYSLHDEDGPLLERLGLDKGFRPVAGDDLFAVSTRNANPSKIDTFLRRTTDLTVNWHPSDGAVTSTATVTLRNEAPTDGLPDYVIANALGYPRGTNVTDVAVITPFEATRATVDGVDARVSPLRDGDVWRHTVRVPVPPGATVTVAVELEGEVTPGRRYRLHYSGQPLVNPGPVTLKVTSDAPDSAIERGPGIEVSGGSASASLTDIGQTVLTLRERER